MSFAIEDIRTRWLRRVVLMLSLPLLVPAVFLRALWIATFHDLPELFKVCREVWEQE